MNIVEAPLVLACAGEQLLGIVARAEAEASDDTGVVIVVGGPQYRAGSHRQFVLLARALADAGLPTLRFDVRGMGDGGGGQRAFTELDEDVGVAVDGLLRSVPSLRRVVLCGLCDGASAALLYLQRTHDPRVAGLVLLNPWVRSGETLSRTIVKHYYLQRLTDRGFWAKLLRGQVALKALRELGSHLGAMWRGRSAGSGAAAGPTSYQERMLAGLDRHPGPVLLALCGDDYTAKEFLEHAQASPAWSAALGRPGLRRLDIAGADHTLSSTEHRRHFEAATIAWLVQEGFR